MGGEDPTEGRTCQVFSSSDLPGFFHHWTCQVFFIIGLARFPILGLQQLADFCREFALAFEWVEGALSRQRREGGGNPGNEVLLRQVRLPFDTLIWVEIFTAKTGEIGNPRDILYALGSVF